MLKSGRMFVTSNWILFQIQQDVQSSIYYESKDLPFYGISQVSRFSIRRNWVGIRGRHAIFFKKKKLLEHSNG